jgi:peptidoglycan/LPS O-acetylase OafA/YrhL
MLWQVKIVLTTKDVKERRYDLDLLRIFANLLLIPYHSSVIFAPNFVYYVHNSNNSFLTEIFIMSGLTQLAERGGGVLPPPHATA